MACLKLGFFGSQSRGTPTFTFGQELLAQADILRRDFDQLVIIDELERLLE